MAEINETFTYNGHKYILLKDGSGYECDGFKEVDAAYMDIIIDALIKKLEAKESNYDALSENVRVKIEKIKPHKKG